MEGNKKSYRERFKYSYKYTGCSMEFQRGSTQSGSTKRDSTQRSSSQRGSPIFWWLVQYHTEENLRPYLEQHLSATGNHHVENGRENEFTTGCLILENGETLVNKLRQERLVLDHQPPHFQPATSYEQLADFLQQNKRKDGAFFYDGKHQWIARVARYANNSPAIEAGREKQTSLIPPDFFSYGSTANLTGKDLDHYSGTKTDLAMVLPVAYSSPDCTVHAYQIKRTAYAGSGLGKVAAFGPQGLEEEFFFREYEDKDRDKDKSKSPLVLPPYPLVGVHRAYEPGEEGIVKVREGLVDLADGLKGGRRKVA